MRLEPIFNNSLTHDKDFFKSEPTDRFDQIKNFY